MVIRLNKDDIKNIVLETLHELKVLPPSIDGVVFSGVSNAVNIKNYLDNYGKPIPDLVSVT